MQDTQAKRKRRPGITPKRWGGGEDTAEEGGGQKAPRKMEWGELADDNALQREITDLLNEPDMINEMTLRQDRIIQSHQKTIEEQRVAIDAGSITIAMLQRQWKGEKLINNNIWWNFKSAGGLLTVLGN